VSSPTSAQRLIKIRRPCLTMMLSEKTFRHK
jgi:hypothetical protein